MYGESQDCFPRVIPRVMGIFDISLGIYQSSVGQVGLKTDTKAMKYNKLHY